jgi:hypothetical protein
LEHRFLAERRHARHTSEAFAQWKGNVFVGSMMAGRIRWTGHVQRLTFENGQPIQREPRRQPTPSLG